MQEQQESFQQSDANFRQKLGFADCRDTTAIYRYPQLYADLFAMNKHDPIQNILLIGPGSDAIRVDVDQKVPTFLVSYQYLLLAALLPDAKITIIEPDMELYKNLKRGSYMLDFVAKYFDEIVKLQKFNFNDNTELESLYRDSIETISNNLHCFKKVNSSPNSIIERKMMYGKFEDCYQDVKELGITFDAIIATNSILYSIIENKIKSEKFMQLLQSLLSVNGVLYIDDDTKAHIERLSAEEAKKSAFWSTMKVLTQPFPPIKEIANTNGLKFSKLTANQVKYQRKEILKQYKMELFFSAPYTGRTDCGVDSDCPTLYGNLFSFRA